MTDTIELLDMLLRIADRLISLDADNADRHRAIMDSLSEHRRRKFGPRFGDNICPFEFDDEPDEDELCF